MLKKSYLLFKIKFIPLLFETEHLPIREYTTDDADTFFLFNSNEIVMRYLRPVKTREEYDIFLAENINNTKRILEPEDGW